MGCDIHLYKEKYIDGRWLAADTWIPCQMGEMGDGETGIDVPVALRFNERNYALFGLLAGVRERYPFSLTPRGLPIGVCEEIAAESARWGMDGHSHSYLHLAELRELLDQVETLTLQVMCTPGADDLVSLRKEIEAAVPGWDASRQDADWNSTSKNVPVELDIPASFFFRDGLKAVISSFDGIEGEDHRIVFFFDN